MATPGSGTSARDAVIDASATSLIQFKARQLTRRRGFNRSDHEDLQQQITLHLLNQAHHYDPARGSINTFVARVVDSCVAMILRDARRLKRGAGIRTTSLDEAALRAGGTPTDEQQEEQVAHKVRSVLDKLPPELQDIARRLMGANDAATDSAGVSVSAIARDLGVSRRQVHNAIQKLRSYFEDAGLHEF